MRSERMETARALIIERLESREVIDAAAIVQAAGIEIPEARALIAWRNSLIRGMVHRLAAEMDLPAVSLGGGRMKVIDTAEESALAEHRAARHLIGQARRRRVIRKLAATRDATHRQLTLEECEVTGHATATPGVAEQSA